MLNIIGINNIITLKLTETVGEKVNISIEGNNNTIIIEEFVDVSKRLDINIVDSNSSVYIGRGTTIEEVVISVADNHNSVYIGEDCMFSSNCKILASDFHSIIDLSTGVRKNISKGVRIEDHVWVGMGALVLKNAHIKSNSIIGANAVVNRMIPPNSIYQGESKISGGGGKEVSWERKRNGMFLPTLDLYGKYISKLKLRNIKWSETIVFNIENKMSASFNKIKGWAFLKEKDSKESDIYVCFYFKQKKLGERILPLNTNVREDVENVFNDKRYLYCGFESYMPRFVIENKSNIIKVELIIKNNNLWGRTVIFDRIKK